MRENDTLAVGSMDQDLYDKTTRKLSYCYTDGYLDREQAMRDFGRDNEFVLRQLLERGHLMEELVDSAKIGVSEHFAGLIREGMGIAFYLRNSR